MFGGRYCHCVMCEEIEESDEEAVARLLEAQKAEEEAGEIDDDY